MELRAVKRAIAAEQKLDAVKAHLVETEAVLRKSLEAKRWSERLSRTLSGRSSQSGGRWSGQRSRTLGCSRG